MDILLPYVTFIDTFKTRQVFFGHFLQQNLQQARLTDGSNTDNAACEVMQFYFSMFQPRLDLCLRTIYTKRDLY